MRNPPDDYSLTVWIWPRALPLPEIFGSAWDDEETRARFVTLASQWRARQPAEYVVSPNGSDPEPGGHPEPGKWLWHPVSRRIHAAHTYLEGPNDWLEATIRWEATDTSPSYCRLTALLDVACRCEHDHGQHRVVELSRLASGPAATLDAFAELLRNMDQWLAASRAPDWWRRYAGF